VISYIGVRDMPRIPIWLSKDEFEILEQHCENCGLAPYSVIKELVLGKLEEIRNERGKNGSGTQEGRQRAIKIDY